MSRRNSAGWALVMLLALLAGCGAQQQVEQMEVEPPQAQQSDEITADTPETVAEQPQDETDTALQELLLTQCTNGEQAAGGSWSACLLPPDGSAAVMVHAQPLRSASLIKLYVAGAVCAQWDAVDAQEQYDGETDTLLRSMLSVSDNEATNTLVRRLGSGDAAAGMAQVNAYCAGHGYADSSMGRLMLDFDAAGDNFTSTVDCCAFLRAVVRGEVTGSERILAALRAQERTSKLPAGVPDGIETANKTGELDDVENDAVIVWAPGGTYFLCMMADGVSDPAAARTQITAASAAIYASLEG